MGANQNISRLGRDGRALAIALRVLTRRLLNWGSALRNIATCSSKIEMRSVYAVSKCQCRAADPARESVYG